MGQANTLGDLADTNRVVKYIIQNFDFNVRSEYPNSICNVLMQLTAVFVSRCADHPQTDLRHLVHSTLRGGEFWLPDGSAVNNDSMVSRVHDLLRTLSRVPTSSPFLAVPSAETVVAAAYLRYKAEVLPSSDMRARRSRLSIPDFVSECGVGTDLGARRVASASRTLVAALKSLVAELPYVDKKDVRVMTTPKVLHYLEEVLNHKESLIQQVRGEASPSLGAAVRPEQKPLIFSKDEASKEDVDDNEIYEYIRTPEEVAALRQLHENIYGK